MIVAALCRSGRRALRAGALEPPQRQVLSGGCQFLRSFSVSAANCLPRFTPGSAVPGSPLHQIDPPLRFTVFDSKGRVTSVSAMIDRKKFIKENKLHSRDLRHIDGPTRALVPYIQVHKGSNILVNICDLRALIKSNEVLIFHSKDPAIAERLSMLVYDLSSKLSNRSKLAKAQDYEQTALEVVLTHAVAFLEVELKVVARRVEDALDSLEVEVSYDKLKDLLRSSTELKHYYRRTLAVRKALDDALDDAPGLLDMYLTDSTRGENPQNFNDIEILLETYYSQADELVQKAGRIVRDTSMTEEVMNIMIDAHRNALILFRLEISVLTVGLGLAIFFADLFGMNLENFIEEKPWGMLSASAVITVISIVGTMFNFKRLAHTRRVFMPYAGATGKPKAHREALKQWLVRSRQMPNPPSQP